MGCRNPEVVARVRVNYILDLCPNRIMICSQVPDLCRQSKKRKRTSNRDLDSSDDDAVAEILMQRQARQQKEEDELNESGDGQPAHAAVSTEVCNCYALKAFYVTYDHFENTTAHPSRAENTNNFNSNGCPPSTLPWRAAVSTEVRNCYALTALYVTYNHLENTVARPSQAENSNNLNSKGSPPSPQPQRGARKAQPKRRGACR